MNLDPNNDYHARVLKRLDEEIVIWMTVVTSEGRPQPNPVWFLWEPERESLLIYSRGDAKRIAHLKANPEIALHFNSNERGGDIMVFAGRVEDVTDSVPSAEKHEVYVEKYAEDMKRIGKTAESFAEEYSIAYRVKPRRVRGF